MDGTRHLDIGCGRSPRNPFGHDKLFGVDILEQPGEGFDYRKVNVVIDPLPYVDSSFDSVSAYDFIEHVPRIAIIDGVSQFPFINLMNNIYRVLKPGGVFFAVTPCYPRLDAFTDPTHVNFITKKTHTYFTLPDVAASTYGFVGKFEVVKVKKVKASQIGKMNQAWPVRVLKDILYTVLFMKKTHILWIFKAVK